jgi:hypothetical protein
MQERIISEQTQFSTEKLKLAEEKAKLDALAKLQGVSGSASFDVLKVRCYILRLCIDKRNTVFLDSSLMIDSSVYIGKPFPWFLFFIKKI